MPDAPDKRLQKVYYPVAMAHLVRVPMHRAIVRTAEAVLLRDVPLERPTLDAGCGDGIFAAIAFRPHLDLGIDVDVTALREAHSGGSHRLVLCSDLGALPLASASIGSIVCNSVIEHVPHADRALAEFGRILKPGGWLILTTPTPSFSETLLTVRLLKKVRLKGLAQAYGRWFNKISRHYSLLSPEEWASKLLQQGFHVKDIKHYLDTAAMGAFELAHYVEAYRLVIKGLLGRWVLFPKLAVHSPPMRLKAFLIGKMCAREPQDLAGYVYILAQKAIDSRGVPS